jgi:hypothetical protein
MSFRAVVTVPAWSVPGLIGADSALTASFALAGPGAPNVVERVGPLGARLADAGFADAPEDPLLESFLAACAHVGRPVPRGVRVRAASRVPAHLGHGARAAAAVAGAAAANALLGLGLTERDVGQIAATVAGAPAFVASALRGHRVSMRPACDDLSLPRVPAATGADVPRPTRPGC